MSKDDIGRLVQDLAGAPAKAAPLITKALKFTATGIKNDWRQGATVSGKDGFSGNYPNSISYDITPTGDGVEAEIGPDISRNGGTAGFLEDAPGNVKAAPQHAGRDALEANEDDFVRGLEIAIFDAITGDA